MRVPVLLVAAVVLAAPLAARADDPSVRAALSRGHQFQQAGNRNAAEQAFREAMALPAGAHMAEVRFALGDLLFQAQDALAAYLVLREARDAAKTDPAWDGGDGGQWNARVAQRVVFIERNLAALKLVWKGGDVVLPEPSPKPDDPALRALSDRVPAAYAEAKKAGTKELLLLVPAGAWRVGEKPLTLEKGAVDPAHPFVVELRPPPGADTPAAFWASAGPGATVFIDATEAAAYPGVHVGIGGEIRGKGLALDVGFRLGISGSVESAAENAGTPSTVIAGGSVGPRIYMTDGAPAGLAALFAFEMRGGSVLRSGMSYQGGGLFEQGVRLRPEEATPRIDLVAQERVQFVRRRAFEAVNQTAYYETFAAIELGFAARFAF
jgi:hypothetical protein